MTAVGFEPTPFRNGALSHRLRPLGQTVLKTPIVEKANKRSNETTSNETKVDSTPFFFKGFVVPKNFVLFFYFRSFFAFFSLLAIEFYDEFVRPLPSKFAKLFRILMATILGLGLEILGAFVVRPPGGIRTCARQGVARICSHGAGLACKNTKK